MTTAELVQLLVGLSAVATGAALLFGWPAALIVVGLALYLPPALG